MLPFPLRALFYSEVVRILKRSERTIRRWVKAGIIRSTKKGNTVFLNREDVLAIVKAEGLDESED